MSEVEINKSKVESQIPEAYKTKLEAVSGFGLTVSRKADMEEILVNLDVDKAVRQELLARANTYQGQYVVFDAMGDGEDFVIVGDEAALLIDEAIRHFEIEAVEPVKNIRKSAPK